MARHLLNLGDLIPLAERAGYQPAQFARLCRLSPWQLRRQFHRTLGKPPREWLTELRLEKARSLLSSEKLVKEAAIEASFTQTSNFSRWFKKELLLRPSDFKNGCSPAAGPNGAADYSI
jgi:AraC-like DNA-binding protein